MLAWIVQIYNKKNVFASGSFSALISKVAAVAVALSVMVLILSFSVLRGFKGLVKEKMAGFSGHIQVLNASSAINYEYEPFLSSDELVQFINSTSGIVSVYPVAQKGGIAKSKTDLEGLVLKGLLPQFDSAFYQSIVTAGRLPRFLENERSNEILLSDITAKKLNIEVGDQIKVYFFKEDQVKGFAPTVVGIFKTGAEEYDKLFAICSYRDILSSVLDKETFKKAQEKNQLGITQLEVKVKDFSEISEVNNQLKDLLPYTLRSETIMTLQSQVFDWLSYLDKNIQIILILMILVAGINMITAILTLIVDNTQMIGLLKSIGVLHQSLVKLFVALSLNIVVVGLLIGNALAVGLIFLQQKYKFLTLDEENYYTSFVPLDLNWIDILLINVGTLLVIVFLMVVPAQYIARITPVKALTFQ